MTSLRTVVIAVSLISFFTFVAFFGRLPGLRYVLDDSSGLQLLIGLRRTPIGLLHRAIWIHGPNQLSRVDKILTNGRISRSASRFWNYLLYEKHPIVLVSCSRRDRPLF
jgi:palmitoyltransferase